LFLKSGDFAKPKIENGFHQNLGWVHKSGDGCVHYELTSIEQPTDQHHWHKMLSLD
jgi:hypothetical protein